MRLFSGSLAGMAALLAAACAQPSSDWTICRAPQGDFTAQERACSTVIERQESGGDVAEAYRNRGGARARLGRDEEAIADFTQAIHLEPNDTLVYFDRGSALSRTGAYDRAIRDLDRALQLNPNQAYVLNEACWARAMAGADLEHAAALCDSAVAQVPTQSAFLDSRGLVRLKQGDFENALTDYEAAIRLNPNSAHYIYGRGLALMHLSREAEGQAAFDEALRLDPEIAEKYERYGVKP